ncbi:unnamed protein product [Rhizophagus irregularis]|nr:unnamed protein product [Rhizophagus irregularis]
MTVLFILGNVKTRILERNRFQNTVFTQTRWAEVDKVNNEMMLRRDSSDRKNGIEATKLVTIFSSIYSPYPPIHLFGIYSSISRNSLSYVQIPHL